MTGRRPILAICLLISLAFPAAGETKACYSALADDPARLACDVDRARLIMSAATLLHTPLPDGAMIEIVDTVSASGASYVYSFLDQEDQSWLEARSVPDPQTSAVPCYLRTTIPEEVSQSIHRLLPQLEELPAYGPREDVIINPDGSRTIRLALESHDIITFLHADSGTSVYSRHAGSADAVNELSRQIIAIADRASTWNCPENLNDPPSPINLPEREQDQ